LYCKFVPCTAVYSILYTVTYCTSIFVLYCITPGTLKYFRYLITVIILSNTIYCFSCWSRGDARGVHTTVAVHHLRLSPPGYQ